MTFASLNLSDMSRFCRKVECLRMILDGELDDIVGFVKLSGGTLWTDLVRKGENTGILLETCTSETRRVLILEGLFRIRLSGKEKRALKAAWERS
jgi:hypothetical protein